MNLIIGYAMFGGFILGWFASDILLLYAEAAASHSETPCTNLDLSRPCSNAIYLGACKDCDTRLKSVRSKVATPSECPRCKHQEKFCVRCMSIYGGESGLQDTDPESRTTLGITQYTPVVAGKIIIKGSLIPETEGYPNE